MTDIIKFAPHFEGCDTPEPSLGALIYRYYGAYFDDPEEARRLAHLYIESLIQHTEEQKSND